MIAQFKTLFTVAVAHAYYGDGCEDINYVIPSDTAQILRNGKLMARGIDGTIVVVFEGDGAGGIRAPIPGKKLRFGLTLSNLYFSNFTAVDADFASATLFYQNAANAGALDAASKVSMVGQRFSHDLSKGARPVTVTLTDANGSTVQADTVTSSGGTTVSYDLAGRAAGAYAVTEAYAGSTVTSAYYSDSELLAARAFGVMEIEIASVFYQTPATFSLPFAAREETLKYYVVVTNYPAATPSPWSVADNGSAVDGRAAIAFDQIASGSFTPGDIAPGFLGDPTATVVLFQSTATVARSEKARTNIQLLNGGEVLIPNLPQPGQDKTNADMIIAISKPNASTTTL